MAFVTLYNGYKLLEYLWNEAESFFFFSCFMMYLFHVNGLSSTSLPLIAEQFYCRKTKEVDHVPCEFFFIVFLLSVAQQQVV